MSISKKPIMLMLLVACLLLSGYLAYPYLSNGQVTPKGDLSANLAQNTTRSSFQHIPAVKENSSDSQSSVSAPSAATLDQLLADALENADAKKRVAAIESLALAPKNRAMPILEKSLTLGSLEEKQAAIRSMREIAVRQNDVDGSIRNFLGQVGYHYDIQEVSADIQSALDYIQKNIG